MNIRYIATAFIRSDDDWLLMRRSDSCKIAPGYWYGVGGHIEADEFSQPAAACIREIEEESGLKAEQIEDLSLKLIAMRRSGSETVINYIFTAKARTREVISSEEGELFWVHTTDLTNKQMADVIKLIIERLLLTPESSEQVVVGVMNDRDNPRFDWIELSDWPSLF